MKKMTEGARFSFWKFHPKQRYHRRKVRIQDQSNVSFLIFFECSFLLHRILKSALKWNYKDSVQTQTDNDTPAEDLHEIFVVVFVVEFEQAEEKMEISMQNVERYKQRNIDETI